MARTARRARVALRLGVALVVLVLGAGAAQAERVVLWHSYRGEEQKALEEAAQLWLAAHPGDELILQAVPADAYSYKLESAIPRGNGPDLFITSHEVLGDFVRAGLVEPLDGADVSGLEPAAVRPLQKDGHLWGVPLAEKTLALFYRPDKMPAPPTDTERLAREGKRARLVGSYVLAYETGSMFHHAAWVHAFGGQLLDDKGRPALASPGQEAALAAVARLQADGLVPEESSSSLATQLFNEGRAWATLSGPWFLGEIAPRVPFAVAPLPMVTAAGKRLQPLLTVEAVFLAARARAPGSARALAAWLGSTECALLRAVKGRQVVTTTAAWSDPRLAQDPILGAFRAQLADTVPMSTEPAMRAVWEPGQRALRRVLRGAATPHEALADAQHEVEARLKPAPPAAAPLPYAALLGALALAGAFVLVRRARDPEAGFAAVVNARGAYGWLLPAGLSMVLLVFVPFAVGAAMSLFHYDGAHWTFVGAGNFVDILASKDGPIWAPLSFYFTLAVTLLWTALNVALHVVIGVTLALLLRDPALKLRGLYRTLLIVPWAVPNYITALIWKGMFHRQFGAINGILKALGLEPVSWFSQFWTAFCANLATNVWLGFPFMMVVTLGALARISPEIEEAAALDGASKWQRLRHIVLPLTLPAMVPSIVLGCVWTFNMFNIVFLVSGGEPDGSTEILVSQAYRWAFTRGHRYGTAAAYAVLVFVLLLVQTRLARRVTERAEASP